MKSTLLDIQTHAANEDVSVSSADDEISDCQVAAYVTSYAAKHLRITKVLKLRGLSRRERKEEAKKYSWDYVWFGTMAMILELIPLLSFFFLLTTTAGCGLWVAKLEGKTRVRPSEGGARAEEGRAVPPEASWRAGVAEEERDEPPPPYSDDPI